VPRCDNPSACLTTQNAGRPASPLLWWLGATAGWRAKLSSYRLSGCCGLVFFLAAAQCSSLWQLSSW
jgi:hypothetical protein